MADEIQGDVKVKQINLPSWTIEAAKIVSAVVIALSLGYVRFSVVENRVADHSVALGKVEARTESNKESINQVGAKVGTLELQQVLVSGEFRDSLKRIEEDVKELKSDIKTGRAKP